MITKKNVTFKKRENNMSKQLLKSITVRKKNIRKKLTKRKRDECGIRI